MIVNSIASQNTSRRGRGTLSYRAIARQGKRNASEGQQTTIKAASSVKKALNTVCNAMKNGLAKIGGAIKQGASTISSKTPKFVKTTGKYTAMTAAGLTVLAGVGLAAKEVSDQIKKVRNS